MKITFKQIEKKVRELAKRSPNNVYDKDEEYGSCFYSTGKCSDGSMGCIFGQALTVLGVNAAFFDNLDKGASPYIDTVLDTLKIKTTPKQENWALLVQDSQDGQLSWKEAVECADEECK